MSNLPFDGRADKAEQQLLGSCLICREALPKALEAGLTEDDFFGQHHRAMFAAMVALHRDGKAGEIIPVSARMQTMGTGNHLAAHGGDAYLAALGNEAPVSGFAELAQVVKLAAYDRQLALLRTEQRQSGQSAKKRSEITAQIRRVQSERDRLAEYCDGWPGEPGPPLPFTDSVPPPWPTLALPPVLAEFVQAVAAYSQVPASMPALIGLGTLSCMLRAIVTAHSTAS